MDCPYCGTANPALARFCLGCGRPLVAGVVCATCHTLLPAQARYCFHCGAVIVPRAALCPHCGASVLLGQAACPTCGAALPLPALGAPPAAVVPAAAAPVPAAATPPAAAAVPVEPAGTVLGRLPTARPFPAMLASLQRYLPHALWEPLERRPTGDDLDRACGRLTNVLNATRTYLPGPVFQAPQPPGVPAGNLYQGTFLFVDVSGFTPLSEALSRFAQAGAERITQIINGLFNDLVAILHAHGGTLLKFGGDALLGLFGQQPVGRPGTSGRTPSRPEAMAEGALRAVQAALAMQGIMDRFAAIEAGGETRALRVKCGISSGPFFAAHLGTPRIMAYVTTGHTVNRADQAESHATPGDVVITQASYELIGSQLDVEPRDEGFFLVRGAPPLAGEVQSVVPTEPPPGAVDARITYLVDRLDCLSPYLPVELVDRIVTSPLEVQITPDHRRVTVMFANYLGVSDLIEDMGATRPEAITTHLNDYFVHMATIVEQFEGSLARMDQYSIGDRLVIFFGAPRAHEDDPVRAVYTALDMQAATHQHFAALQLPEGIYRFRQRIGINTGHLFAGNVGAPDRRQEYTLMGDDINMAARLMSKAEWGDILISDKTLERVEAFFEVRDRGRLKVKGKEILVPTFQVVGPREKIGQTRGLSGGPSPLTDREDELATLKHCGELLQGGRGGIVALIGNSGLGKSRLTRELRHWLFGQPGVPAAEIGWLEGHALSFTESISYWLAASVLLRAANLKPETSPDDRLYALWEQGETLLGKAAAREVVPFLAYVLDLPLKGEWARWVADLDPKVRQKQTFWAVREFCTAAARQRPLVIVLDDLHWADEASLALLEDVLQVTDVAPVLFCLVFRERRDKGCWRVRDRAAAGFPHRYVEVALKPLADAYGRQLLERLLPGADLAPDTVRQILDKSAGNPFYLEEVVRSLIAAKAVVEDESQLGRWRVAAGIGDIAVPDTLQGAILARIDRLTEDARQALQMAAVIGRRFQLDALRGLAGAEAEMELCLAQLERSGLIQPLSSGASLVYTFPDALVQEVAYESLLVQRRHEFHRRVGETLEGMLGERADQECELLAYHYGRSDNDERARHYLELAGRKAQAGFANETALHCYSELLARLPAPTDQAAEAGPSDAWEKRFDVLRRRQQVYGLLGQQAERQADVQAMLDLAEAQHDDAGRAAALNALADLCQWTGRYAESVQAATDALALETALGDQAGQAESLHQLGVVYYYRGDYDQAGPALEQAVTLRQATDNPEGEAWSLMYLGMIHFVRGHYSQAARLHGQALDVARSRQDWFQEAIHLTNAARVSLRLGQYDQALEQLLGSLEKKRRVGDRTGQGFSLFYIGLVHATLEHYDQAETWFRESLDLRRQIGDNRGIGYCLHGLGLVALGRGSYAEAAGHFQEAFELRSQLGLKAEVILDLSQLGQAHLLAGDLDRAAEVSTRAMDLLAEQQHMEEVQQVYLNHFRVLSGRGDPAARQCLEQAYQAVMDVADRIAEPEHRQSFLAQVPVNRSILTAREGTGAEVPGQA